MYGFKRLLLALVPIVFFVTAAQAASVPEMAVGTGVYDRSLQGVSDHFDSEVGKLYAFTRIEGLDGGHVTHRWYYGGELMAEVRLSVRSNDWRTWSSKNVFKAWVGDWRVDVVSESGALLKSMTFKVGNV